MLVNLQSQSCLNGYKAKPESRPNVYKCNRADPEQQFRVIRLRNVDAINMDVMLQLANISHRGKPLCLDDVNGHFQFHYCNAKNQNMVFRMDKVSSYIATEVVDRGTQESNRTYVNVNGLQYYDLEVWLVARKRPTWVPSSTQTGHAFIGMVGRERTTGRWSAIRTYSFWPENNDTKRYQESNSDLTISYPADFNHLKDLLNGKAISDRGHAIRKSRLTASRAVWILNGAYRQAGCRYYRLPLTGENCHCADYSTRLWHYLSSGWDDFRIQFLPDLNIWTGIRGSIVDGILYHYWPDAVVDSINKQNHKTGSQFLDNGKRW